MTTVSRSQVATARDAGDSCLLSHCPVDRCCVLCLNLTFQQVDRSGKLGYEEFKKLWNDLRLWKVCQSNLKSFCILPALDIEFGSECVCLQALFADGFNPLESRGNYSAT